MKRIAPVVFIVLIAAVLPHAQEEPIRLAVAPFDDTLSPAAEAEGAGVAVSSALESMLAKSPSLRVREAGAIAGYITLLEKVQCGIEEPKALKRNVSKLQVDYLAVGSVSKLGGGYEVDARVVDVNTWRIVLAGGVRASSGSGAAVEMGNSFAGMTRAQMENGTRAGRDNPTVGVNGFRDHYGNLPGSSFCGTFMEMLTGGLGSRALVNTLETRFIRHLIEEKILEMAGVIENNGVDEKFRIEGVQSRVAGDIRVFPDMICVNFRLIDTEKSRVIYTGSVEITGPGALRPAAGHVAKVIEDALNNRIGTLKIRTVPAGAEILIDGVPAGRDGVGVLVTTLDRGKHVVTARLPGYRVYTGGADIVPRRITEMSIRFERINERLLREAMGLESRGMFADAVAKYDEFIEETGDMPEANMALYRKGHVLLLQMKEYGRALDAFNALLERYPDAVIRAEGYYGKALTYRAMGNEAMAKATAKFLAEVYPDSSSAAAAREIAEGSIERR